MFVLDPVSTVTMPVPALRILPLNSALLSKPPAASTRPPVALLRTHRRAAATAPTTIPGGHDTSSALRYGESDRHVEGARMTRHRIRLDARRGRVAVEADHQQVRRPQLVRAAGNYDGGLRN